MCGIVWRHREGEERRIGVGNGVERIGCAEHDCGPVRLSSCLRTVNQRWSIGLRRTSKQCDTADLLLFVYRRNVTVARKRVS